MPRAAELEIGRLFCERIAVEARVRVDKLRSEDAVLRKDLERWLPEDQREALRGIESNVDAIGTRLRALAAAGAS